MIRGKSIFSFKKKKKKNDKGWGGRSDQIREDSDQETITQPIVESPMDSRKKAGVFVIYLVRDL